MTDKFLLLWACVSMGWRGKEVKLAHSMAECEEVKEGGAEVLTAP